MQRKVDQQSSHNVKIYCGGNYIVSCIVAANWEDFNFESLFKLYDDYSVTSNFN